MESKTFTTPQSGEQFAPIESENEMTRTMLEAARVAVAKVLAQKKTSRELLAERAKEKR